MALARLPIDDVLPDVAAAVRAHRTCVLVAPPGAGKTTRVPGALLPEIDGSIVVLQPRRLAARLAAARIASERGTELGGEVGYQVRFDRRISAATRIELVTEGVLTRRLLSDPELRGVGCVAIDEFHERHLDGDLALALVARLRERRPELALVVMSATLDAEPVAAFLGNAPIVRSEGRTFPIEIEYTTERSDAQLGKQISAAVRRICQDKSDDGDILVFLPGTGEIRRAAEDLADCATTFDLAILPLHGELTADEQDRAVRPSQQRKVILATNVAETSVTIDGVTCVIDSGLARIARHSPWSGIPSLEIEPISRASATQRAGRAGRTRPGRVIRLYTKHDHETRRAFDAPEIARADLAGAALELHGAGIAGVQALRWFEPPPRAAAEVAERRCSRAWRAERAAGSARSRTRRGHAHRTESPGGACLRFLDMQSARRRACCAEAERTRRRARGVRDRGAARRARAARSNAAAGGADAKQSSPSDLIDDLDAFRLGWPRPRSRRRVCRRPRGQAARAHVEVEHLLAYAAAHA